MSIDAGIVDGFEGLDVNYNTQDDPYCMSRISYGMMVDNNNHRTNTAETRGGERAMRISTGGGTGYARFKPLPDYRIPWEEFICEFGFSYDYVQSSRFNVQFRDGDLGDQYAIVTELHLTAGGLLSHRVGGRYEQYETQGTVQDQTESQAVDSTTRAWHFLSSWHKVAGSTDGFMKTWVDDIDEGDPLLSSTGINTQGNSLTEVNHVTIWGISSSHYDDMWIRPRCIMVDDATSISGTPDYDGYVRGVDTAAVTYGLVGNLTALEIEALSPAEGDAYVVTTANGVAALSAAAIGDIWEYQSSTWTKVATGSGGYVPVSTKAHLSIQEDLISPYTDDQDENGLVTFSGSSNSPTPAEHAWAVVYGWQSSSADSESGSGVSTIAANTFRLFLKDVSFGPDEASPTGWSDDDDIIVTGLTGTAGLKAHAPHSAYKNGLEPGGMFIGPVLYIERQTANVVGNHNTDGTIYGTPLANRALALADLSDSEGVEHTSASERVSVGMSSLTDQADIDEVLGCVAVLTGVKEGLPPDAVEISVRDNSTNMDGRDQELSESHEAYAEPFTSTAAGAQWTKGSGAGGLDDVEVGYETKT